MSVRIVAATNRDLETMCAEGSFREDLYFRVNAVTLELPPLRQRREEIGPLVDKLVADAVRATGGGTPVMASPAIRTSPASRSSKPLIAFSKVVLPQPDGPSRVTNCRCWISREMPSSAVMTPPSGAANRFTAPLTSAIVATSLTARS